MEQEILTSAEAARYLGYSEHTLKSARSRNELGGLEPPRAIKIGRTVRYRKTVLDEWIAQVESETE